MPLLAGIIIVLQICVAYHAVKNRKPYWWLFVILAFPVMGCLIYYVVEVFQGSREQRRVESSARKVVKALQPNAELQRRAVEVEVCGSVENKIALAEECVERGMPGEAQRLYESCLVGAFEQDGKILFGLARAAVEGEDWAKAEDALARLNEAAPKTRPLDVRLLQVRMLAGRGESAAALAAYEDLVPRFFGLEASYRYIVFLLGTDEREAACQVFRDMQKHTKRAAALVDGERHWLDAARRALATVPASASLARGPSNQCGSAPGR